MRSPASGNVPRSPPSFPGSFSQNAGRSPHRAGNRTGTRHTDRRHIGQGGKYLGRNLGENRLHIDPDDADRAEEQGTECRCQGIPGRKHDKSNCDPALAARHAVAPEIGVGQGHDCTADRRHNASEGDIGVAQGKDIIARRVQAWRSQRTCLSFSLGQISWDM